MSDQTTQPKPIEVKASATPIISQEAAKTLIVAGCTYWAVMNIHNDQALAAVLPAAVVVATMAINAWQRFRTWGVLKKLANAVSDDVAVVGKAVQK